MGADWLKFQLRSDADPEEVARLASFVNENSPKNYWSVIQPPPWDESLAEPLRHATDRLDRLLVFPHDRKTFDFWSFVD
jgi:hypothetical protein